MSKQLFENENLVTNIALYLEFEDILSLYSCNLALKKILNPLTNKVVNIIYFNQTTKSIFEMDDDDYFDCYNQNNRNNYLDDSWKSNINWRLFLSQTLKHFNIYPDQKITKNVLDAFKIHIYLSDLRKENNKLEYEYSSISQIYFYDKQFKESCNYNYHRKFINENYINNHGNNCKIELLREGLYFEDELKNFINIYDEILDNADYQKIVDTIISYDFEGLEQIYKNINLNRINKVIFFVLWVNRNFIQYCLYILESINKYKDNKQEKDFLEQFIVKFTNYANSSLLINSNFENVNIIINDINCFILKKNVSEKFSLHQLAMKIFERKVFNEINKEILNQTSLLFINLIKKNIEEKNEEKMDIEDDETNFTDKNDCLDDDSFSDFQRKKTDKEIIENVLKCVLDININKYNANAINHSKIKLGDEYDNYEINLINSLIEYLQNAIINEIDYSEIIENLEKLLKNNGNSRNMKIDHNSFKFINRTKKAMIEYSFKFLFKDILSKLLKDFKSRLIPNMNGRILNISNSEQMKNKEYTIDLSDFSSKTRMKIEGKVQNEINNIKNYLYGQNIDQYDLQETQKLANEYMENNGIGLVLSLKKMIYFYCKESEVYDDKDQIIFNILSKRRNATEKGNLNELIKL